jgi:alpha-2-macroglobulin
MQKLPWKKLVAAGLGVALVVVVVLYLFGGKTESKPTAYINPAFGEYISSYTAGVIPSGSALQIVLAKEFADSSLIGKETNVKLFDFSPPVKGKVYWADARTVEFRPEGRLKSGQIYEVGFQLSRLLEVPKELNKFTYTFQVIPQNFGLTVENVKPYVNTELTRQKLEGVLVTSDYALEQDVEKLLQAKQENNDLKITWIHSGDGRNHNFTVEEVTRKETVSKVTLTASGEPLGIKRKEEKEIEIPALGDFKVVQARVVQNPTQLVILQFSDPLKQKQNLQGLISIPGLSSLDFDVRDNEIWIYPPTRQAGTKKIYIESGIRNILDYKMNTGITWEVVFEQLKPAARLTGKGVILPSTDGLVLPFEAVNLKAVDVEVTKIYENNILQFLQVNDLSGRSQLRRVGNRILKKKISLDNKGVTDLGKWNRYTLDLATLINSEPGAIYQVKLNFKKSYSTYTCDNDETSAAEQQSFADEEEIIDEGNYDYYEYDYDYEDYYYDEYYDWDERDNPCHQSYYTRNRDITRNVLASDLGLIAKQGSDGNTIVFVTDLKTTQPLNGVQLEVYDFQQQLIATASSGSDGKAILSTRAKPFALIAKNGAQRGYLTLTDGRSLSLSNFDVSGEYVQKGIKGFLYGDRGVWRPGDSLYLTLILEDRNKILPPTHPVVFEMYNPQGQLATRIVRSSSENGFYHFGTATKPDDPTGNWAARVKVGGTEFSQPLKIETVKPNRLKINLDLGAERITSDNVRGTLDVRWLHGAPGKNLKAEFDVILARANTSFQKYPDYLFEDPARSFSSESQKVFEGYTDAEGKAVVNASLSSTDAAPGFLTAIFKGKVFEEGGNFSIDRFSVPYSPYSTYVGIRTPKGERYSGILFTDSIHKVDFATVNADGAPVSVNLEVSMYKLDWRWWWDNSYGNLANYVNGSYSRLAKNEKISTTNGKGTWSFQMKSPDWGRYLIRACDPVSGHCTGKIVYVDEPGWYSRSRSNSDSKGATMLSFAADKEIYNIGEKVNLTIPSSGQGRALVSIESGSKVIQTYWVETQQGETRFSFEATSSMTPNVFVHVSLLQPHSQAINDLPIRLYGVIPVRVEDSNTHIEPIITMPEVLEPGEEVTIRISEKTKRKMTYTVAMVDEGLLDITRFKTPDAWSRFYAREALGVRTWDLYDDVMGAFGARIERLLSVGGDAELAGKDDDPRANRFKPVVKFFGPFTIEKGDTKTHKFIMPQYIGSVRTMVVAGYEGAYGKAEKATPVRKPLMVLATLPRVLGPEEKLKLPVTLFTQEKSIRNVNVSVKVSGPVSISGNNSQSVAMGAGGDMTVYFDLAVKSAIGVAKVEVTATSGNFKGTDIIEIDVRNPNPPVSRITEIMLEAGKSWNAEATPFGIAGTNTAVLEVSNMPPINLGPRLRYLFQYPYGCVEQTTSSVFPQLYLNQVKVLTENEQAAVQRNITAGIERLKSFTQRDGGFAYWPGNSDADTWGSSYAGHFLLEAELKGYYVPADLIRRWKKYQKDKALEWRRNTNYYNSDLMQAYRLYTLALAGAAELGAMNRLREMGNLSSSAAWMLAAAYAKAGQPEAAKKLIADLSTIIQPYRELGYSYGSDLRDKALIVETLVLLNEKAKAFELVKELSKSLSNNSYWMSTQEVAFSLKAITSFVGLDKRGDLKFKYTLNGKSSSFATELPIAQIPIPLEGTKKESVSLVNESNGTLFGRLILEGTPARGDETEEQSNLKVVVEYTDTKGNRIDPTVIEQGKEFMAVVSVTHPGIRFYYDNLALAQIFPSGWEINNLRLDETQQLVKNSSFTYQDIRDDRVYTYFNLGRNETKTFRILLTASYSGEYYLPSVSCEAMYDRSIYARLKGYTVQVTRPQIQ